MRAACCEATVLRHEVIADDIRLLTALWPDREHAPTPDSSSPCVPGAQMKLPSCPGPSASTSGMPRPRPSSSCTPSWAREPAS